MPSVSNADGMGFNKTGLRRSHNHSKLTMVGNKQQQKPMLDCWFGFSMCLNGVCLYYLMLCTPFIQRWVIALPIRCFFAVRGKLRVFLPIRGLG